MAFKSIKEYNDARFGNMFLLRNDGDFADVVMLYRSMDDVLVADTHYIKSNDYSGYVHCCGRGCPACGKGIRVQSRLFIPVYNIQEDEIQFFDRSIRFENQLDHDVFSRFPNPSEYVFRIRRSGESGDVNTTYSITAVGKNTVMSYNEIMAKFHTKFPDYFDTFCKEYSIAELNNILSVNNNTSSSPELPSYTVTPRVVVPVVTPDPPSVSNETIPEYSSVNSEYTSNVPDSPVYSTVGVPSESSDFESDIPEIDDVVF